MVTVNFFFPLDQEMDKDLSSQLEAARVWAAYLSFFVHVCFFRKNATLSSLCRLSCTVTISVAPPSLGLV